MKKIILCAAVVILLAVLVSLVLWYGANTGPAPTEPQNPSSTSHTSSASSTDGSANATEPTVNISLSSPMVSVSLPILVEEDTADDGTVVFRRTYQDVVLSIPDAEIARTVTLDLLRRMDENSSVLSQIQTDAFADYSGQESWQSYYYRILYSPMRTDEAILSLYGTEDMLGSTQSGSKGLSVNYNLTTGAALTLNDVLSEEAGAAENLLAALLSVLEDIKETYSLFDDYAATVSSRFQSDLHQENCWYFSSEGLTFFYSPYEIAPHTAGIVEATVPYSALTGILRNSYFPAEQVYYPGELTGQAFEQADLDRFTQFSELITQVSTPRCLLHTNGVLYDVTVEQGQWYSDRFQPQATVYALNRLSPKEGLVLQAELPETQSSLRISYTSGEKSYQFYLCSDSDGNIVLTPAE